MEKLEYTLGKMKNKKSWIKLVEAFVAIIFIVGALSIVIYKENLKKENISQEIDKKQIEILHSIQENSALRLEIINSTTIPIDSNQIGFPSNTRNFLIEQTPSNMNCSLNICVPESECLLLNNPNNKEIYKRSIILTSTLEMYSPKKLSLFCWRS